MWQPPERIKHALPETRWPTADESDRSRLFSPVQIGSKTAVQRTWVPAMVPWRATDEGFVTDNVIDWYARMAEGQPGVIVVEATGIRDVPSGPLLRAGHERFVPGLRRLVDAIKDASDGKTLAFIQLIDFLRIRRRPDREKYLQRFLQVEERHHDRAAEVLSRDELRGATESDLRNALAATDDATLAEILSTREMEDYRNGYRERVTDTHLPHIRDLPEALPDLFANAASNSFAAAFDGVELHYAHAYTMASFLSALNTRDDEYGGSRENRVRLPLRVIESVRSRVPGDRIVGLRFLGDDVVDGGNRIDDACYFARRFAEAGVDFLSLSKGGKFEDAKQPKVGQAAYPYTGRSGYECMPTVFSDQVGPFGRNLGLAAAVRKAVRDAGHETPVVAAGGICTFEMAEQALERGEADIIASARQALADPDWFLKTKLGRGDEIRRCAYTNYCEGLDQKHKTVTCKLWDRSELDAPGVTFDDTGKRRLVAPAWKR